MTIETWNELKVEMPSNSLLDHPVQCRYPREEELLLVSFLLSKHPRGAELIGGLQNARVAEMADGGMGSVTFDPNHVRKFGGCYWKRLA